MIPGGCFSFSFETGKDCNELRQSVERQLRRRLRSAVDDERQRIALAGDVARRQRHDPVLRKAAGSGPAHLCDLAERKLRKGGIVVRQLPHAAGRRRKIE